jgi:hypothetical protein
MASVRSQSSQAPFREHSLGATGAEYGVNGDTPLRSDSSGEDVRGTVPAEEEDGDLFSDDDGDEEAASKPYVAE